MLKMAQCEVLSLSDISNTCRRISALLAFFILLSIFVGNFSLLDDDLTRKQHNNSGATWSPPKYQSYFSLYKTHNGLISDKWSHYPFIYDELLLPIYKHAVEVERIRQSTSTAPNSNKNSKFDLPQRPRMLELGTQNGGSLQIHNIYFHGLIDIIAMDIDPTVNRLVEETELGQISHIRIIIGNASDESVIVREFGIPPISQMPEIKPYRVRPPPPDFIIPDPKYEEAERLKAGKLTADEMFAQLDNLQSSSEKSDSIRSDWFDLIIDDASHINSEVIETFKILFPYVRPGGLYVIEDSHTTFIENRFYGGYGKSHTLLAFFKSLIDRIVLHPLYDRSFNGAHVNMRFLSRQVYFYRWIRSIEFEDGVIVIRKAHYPKPSESFCRVVAGKEDPIHPLGEDRDWIVGYETNCLYGEYSQKL